MAKKYNTPHREHVIKTRLDDDEDDSFIRRCETYGLSQSGMIRKAISGMDIHPVIKVNAVSPELLDVLNELIRQIVKIGTNLNQIAHMLNAEVRKSYSNKTNNKTNKSDTKILSTPNNDQRKRGGPEQQPETNTSSEA